MTAEPSSHNPYPGPRPFEQEEKELFFGREREVREILSRIVVHRAVLLYAQSGAGKTSLLKAGLIPSLAEKSFEVLPIARVRGPIQEDINPQEIENVYIFNTLTEWAEDKIDAKSLLSMSLVDFLKVSEHFTDKQGQPSLRVVIFDQFEELFTSYPKRWKEREGFFRQVAKALEKDPLLRVLFVIREDYLANIDPYVELLPERLRTRYRLECLRAKAACRAIKGPLRDTDRSFKEGVASKLVERLLNIPAENATGETVAGEYVEPVQLQVVCENLWNSLPPDVAEITSDHLQTFGDVDEALRGFYERAINAAKDKTAVKEKDLRNWFNDQLITPVGTRGTVFQGKMRTGGIRNEAVDILVDKHVIRAEMRARARWYELTHDRLIEPIRTCNRKWFARRSRRRMFRVMAIGLPILLAGICFTVVICKQKAEARWKEAEAQREYNLTTGRMEKLREWKMKDEREWKEMAPMYLDSVADHLWYKGESDKLVHLMKEYEEVIPKTYGVISSKPEPVKVQLPGDVSSEDRGVGELTDSPTPAKITWQLTLAYHPDRRFDQEELRAQWQGHAGFLASSWGMPMPLHIKLRQDPNLQKDEIRVISPYLPHAPPAEAQQPEKDLKSLMVEQVRKPEAEKKPLREQLLPPVEKSVIQRTLNAPLRPDHVLITEAELAKRLRPLFDRHREEWTVLPQLSYRGSWWLVPRWTQPLWRIGGQDAYPPEAGTSLIVAETFLAEPNLILTNDCVRYLLDRVQKQSPQTVAEVLVARGGLDGIRQDLVEVIGQHKRSLTRLTYLLDALASYHGLSASEAADKALKDQAIVALRENRRLRGSSGPVPTLTEDEQRVAARFWDVYAEAGAGLPDIEPAIRVYMGGSIERALVTKESRLVPEVMEALVDLRADLYKRFGVVPPGVRFRTAVEELADNGVRIEMMNQSEGSEDTKPIELTPDRAIEQLLRELRFRYVGLRTWWLTAEKVHGELVDLPAHLRKWLEAHFALTDIKLILQVVIAPTEEELTAYTEGGWTEDGLRHNTPQQTLRDLPWLLGSLTFWRNVVTDRMDPMQIGKCLRRTQGARLDPDQEGVAGSKATDHVRRGIEELGQSNMEVAEGAFKDAVQADKDIAVQAFLTLYPKESRLAPEHRLAWLEGSCTLPDPGDYSTRDQPNIQTRYELEEFLDDPGADVPPDTKRKLRLCLLWNYFAEEHYQKRDELLTELLSEYDPDQWPATEEYFMAYRMLDEHTEDTLKPDYQDWIEKLLQSAFKGLADEQADDAFRELMRIYSSTRAPTWYAVLLHSLAELRPLNYSIPYQLGEYFANSQDHDELEKALDLLNRAESNLNRTELDPNMQRAWIDFKKATAYYKLAWKDSGDYDQQSVSNALKLLENLVANVPPDAERWPPLDLIYAYLVSTYVLADKIDEAATEVEKGLSLFQDSAELLRQSGSIGSIYHDRLFKYKEAYEKYRKVLELEPNNISNRTNFAEANLTTGRFKEAYSLAQKVLEEPDTSPPLSVDRQLAMRFIMISSLVLQGRTDEAHEELKEFISRYKSVFEEYEPGWNYKGSKNFIKQQQMGEKERKLILKLIEVIEKPTPDITMEQFVEP